MEFNRNQQCYFAILVTEEPVPLASFLEIVPGAAMGLAEGLPLAQLTSLSQHTVGEPLLQDPAPIHDLLEQDIASNDLDKMAAKDLEDLASHEMTPVDDPALTLSTTAEKSQHIGPDVFTEIDPDLATKDFSSGLTSSRNSSILSDSPASPDIPPMLLKHPGFETDPENTFKISGDDVEDLKSFKRQVLRLPQVKGKYKTPKTHDWELVTTINQQPQNDATCLPANSTTTIHLTPAEVQSLSREEIGDLFSTNSIVILPAQQLATSSLRKTEDGRIILQYLVDDNFEVQVHDSFAFSSTRHMVQTFDQLPARSAAWILLAGAGVVTRDHVDAAGHATWVHIAAGAGRIWFIAEALRDPSHHVFDNSRPWIDEEWNNCETPSELIEHFYWEAVYLPEGSTFIMQPHTIHLVLTLGPTLYHGGHFYCATTITRTHHARRLEHVHADTMSNETHPGSWLMLNRMMLFAARKILMYKEQSPYPVDQLAALIILNQDPNFFRNPAEQSPLDYRYKLQMAKAATAAKLVASSYPGVKVALQELTLRLVEWKDTLYEQWDDQLAVYQPIGDTQLMQGGEKEQEEKMKGGMGEQSMDMDLSNFG
ncbi:hypothetical protein FRC07_005415 [Ceratobasidium sp. 392]|nr:hypothetical protein FRC07_005415 [Ceratobasidium sp. 392]